MSGAALATLIQGRLAGLISDEEFSAAKAHLAAESAGGASPSPAVPSPSTEATKQSPSVPTQVVSP